MSQPGGLTDHQQGAHRHGSSGQPASCLGAFSPWEGMHAHRRTRPCDQFVLSGPGGRGVGVLCRRRPRGARRAPLPGTSGHGCLARWEGRRRRRRRAHRPHGVPPVAWRQAGGGVSAGDALAPRPAGQYPGPEGRPVGGEGLAPRRRTRARRGAPPPAGGRGHRPGSGRRAH
jgi:hypothetical protein